MSTDRGAHASDAIATRGLLCIAVAAWLLLGAPSAVGAAEDNLSVAQPFAFVVAPSAATRAWFVHYSFGYSKRATDAFANDGLEQTVGVQGPLGYGFAVRGRIAGGDDDRKDVRTAWDVELLHDLLGEGEGFHLGAGIGARREWDGTTVALGRISVGEELGNWNLTGNVLLERPFASDRDTVDVITVLGCSWRANRWARVGVEAFGEDLEGLWEADEAEGGAKLMAGPSVVIVPWDDLAVGIAMGPILYVTQSTGGSAAANNDPGYILRVSVGKAF